MNYNRIVIPGDVESPVPIDTFIATGHPKENYTAIISYDQLALLIQGFDEAVKPFITEGLSPKLNNDDVVTIRVTAGSLRKLARIFHQTKPPTA